MLPSQVSNTWPAMAPLPADTGDLGKAVRRLQDASSGNFFNHVLSSSVDLSSAAVRMVPSDWQYHRDEAVAAAKVGGLTRAEQSWLMALSIAQSMDDNDPRLAYTLDNLASNCFSQGKYAEAEIHCRSAYEAIEKAYGKDHISRVNCLNNLAGIYYCLKRFSLAEQLCVQVLTMFNKALGPEHEYIGLAANNLAMVYHAQGKFQLAQMMYERALPIRQAALGTSDPVVLTMLHNYANVLDELGHAEKSNHIRSELDTNRVWQLFRHDSQEKLSA